MTEKHAKSLPGDHWGWEGFKLTFQSAKVSNPSRRNSPFQDALAEVLPPYSLLTPSSLPPHLESDYGPKANQPAPEDRKPSSGLPYSSMAEELRHPVLTEQAKSGKLVERHPQPTAEMGSQGIAEAWKHRK